MSSQKRDFTGFLILPCAMLMQACLGATYAWPVFVKSLKDSTGLGQGAIQVPFTVFYIVFPATLLFAGKVLAKMGPRWSAVLGSVVFGGGWLTASLGEHNFAFTICGIGVLGGIGVGLAYLGPITSLMLWFPRHKGIVTGLVVGGFGAGAAAVSQAADFLMRVHGDTPYHAFAKLGIVYMVIAGTASLAMKRPKQDAGPDNHGSSRTADAPRLRDVVSEPAFQILYFAMFAGLAAGFIVLANLKQLSSAAVAQGGTAAVSFFALFNALGRIGWGFVFDRLRNPRRVVQANLAIQSVLLLTAPWLLSSKSGLQTLAAIAGMNYGGVLVIYASSVASRWGAQRVGHIYGWLFSANIFASAAPVLAGKAYDAWNSFTVPLIIASGFLLAGTILVQLLPPEKQVQQTATQKASART